MASFYQSPQYFKGGSRRFKTRRASRRCRGGFYPSVMGGVASAGRVLLPLAFRHGIKLMNSLRKTRKAQPKV